MFGILQLSIQLREYLSLDAFQPIVITPKTWAPE